VIPRIFVESGGRRIRREEEEGEKRVDFIGIEVVISCDVGSVRSRKGKDSPSRVSVACAMIACCFRGSSFLLRRARFCSEEHIVAPKSAFLLRRVCCCSVERVVCSHIVGFVSASQRVSRFIGRVGGIIANHAQHA
jgi:hypothetical protein